MLRVSIETQTEFDRRRGNEPANDYVRTEIPGVCEIWYRKATNTITVVRLDDTEE